MEDYVAGSVAPVERCLQDVASCDVYVGIFAWRYGDIPDGHQRSFTELEFRKAVEMGRPTLIFLADERADWPERPPPDSEDDRRTRALRNELARTKLVSFFKSPDELAVLVTAAVALQAEALRDGEAGAGAGARRAPPGRRLIEGLRFADVEPGFRDREEQIHAVRAFLSDRSIKLVTLVGRGGVGKTWLLSKVCAEIERGDLRLSPGATGLGADGIIYLGCGREDHPSLERLFHGVARVLGGTDGRELTDSWRDVSRSTREKVRVLLGKLQEGCYLLVLDRLEDLLSLDATIADPDLRTFFDLCGQLPHALRLFMTSREQPSLGAQATARVIPLEGLPDEDAVERLRDLDPAGDLGLRDASRHLLEEVVHRCEGVPRALGMVGALLAADRTLTLDALLRDARLFDRHVVDNLVAEYHRRLGAAERRVLETLAVFGQPAPIEAIRFLLEPFDPTVDISAALSRLVRGDFCVRGPTGYTLHALDRRHAYAGIAADESGKRAIFRRRSVPYSTAALHRRSAQFLLQRASPREAWHSRDDLADHLSALDHLVRAGEYDEAYIVAESFDFECLWTWGHCEEVLSLRLRLHGHLRSEELRHLNAGNLGLAFWSVGRAEEAITLSREAVAGARTAGNQKALAAWLGNLGLALCACGQFDEALEHLEQALVADRQGGDRQSEAIHLGDIGLPLRSLDRWSEAIRHGGEGLAMARQCGDRRVEANLLAALGWCHLVSGSATDAAPQFREGLAAAEAAASAVGRFYNLLGLAHRAHLDGQPLAALVEAQRAHAVDHPLGRHRSALALGLAYLGAHTGDSARDALQQAVDRCDVLAEKAPRNHDVLYCRAASLVALERTDEARVAYDRAVAITAAKGVLREAAHDLRLLRAVAPNLAVPDTITRRLRETGLG
jgi:tetratricopeptide (TPR) repeat protein